MSVNGDAAGRDLRAGQAQGPAAYRTGPLQRSTDGAGRQATVFGRDALGEWYHSGLMAA